MTPTDEKPQHEAARERPAEQKRPHESPGPRGNPEIEYASLAKGLELLERV